MNQRKCDIHWSEEDNCWVAVLPELPGCMADGDTKEEALSNLKIIEEEWIETALSLGRTIPKGCCTD